MEYLLTLATDPAAWAALVALMLMEVVLGIDNLIFISILTNKLPEEHRSRARKIGISAALVLRILLLGTVAFITQLTSPLFALFGNEFSIRDLILIAGGLFLIWKATKEIHQNVDPEPTPDIMNPDKVITNVSAAIGQILLLDAVFSVDSILTAVGMTTHFPIMVIAIMVAIITMLLAADPLANFIHNNPTIMMLALGFLLLIGTALIAEGFDVHIPKGYIYAAMGFSVLVEGLNMMSRRAHRRRIEEQSNAASADDASK